MRTNNEKVKNIIISLYFVLIVLAVLMSTMLSVFKNLTGNSGITIWAVLVVFGILFLITHRISKYFEYNSDGLQLVILNRGLLLSDFINYREYKVEFAKHRLVSYKIRNFIVFKQLILHYKLGSSQHLKRAVFNVTLVQHKKLKYIQQSLQKIIKENRKKAHQC